MAEDGPLTRRSSNSSLYEKRFSVSYGFDMKRPSIFSHDQKRSSNANAFPAPLVNTDIDTYEDEIRDQEEKEKHQKEIEIHEKEEEGGNEVNVPSSISPVATNVDSTSSLLESSPPKAFLDVPLIRRSSTINLKSTKKEEESESEEETKVEIDNQKEANLYLKQLEKLFEARKSSEKRTCSGRVYSFFFGKVRWLPFPLFWILFFVIVINIYLFVVWYWFYHMSVWSISLWRWGLYLDILLVTIVFSRIFVSIVLFPTKHLFGFTAGYYFISGLRSALTMVLWTVLAWIGGEILLSNVADSERWIIQNIYLCFFLISICRVIKLIFDKILIVSIQKKKFWNRISEFLFREKVLHILLLDPTATKLTKAKSLRTLSSWRFLVKRAKQKNSFDAEELALESLDTSKNLMKNVDRANKGHISVQDLELFFEDPKDIKRILTIFDLKTDGQITFEEILTVVTTILKDRRLLYATLHDSENMGKIIGYFTGIAFWFLMLVMILTVFNANVSNLLLPFGTSLLALAFVFGNSLKVAWESFIFIFFVNPFEVGDKVTYSGMPNFYISKINLLTTEVFAVDGRFIIIPNSQLQTKEIIQHQRSRDYSVTFSLEFHGNTTKKQLSKFKKKVINWLTLDSEHTPWDLDGLMIWVSNAALLWKFNVDIWVNLKDINWANFSRFALPTEKLYIAILEICRELKIEYYQPTIPVRNISSNAELTNRLKKTQ